MRVIVLVCCVLSACAESRGLCPLPDAGPEVADAPPADAPPDAPPPVAAGVVSSFLACNVLADHYFAAVGLGAWECPGVQPPPCPWPASISGGACPARIGDRCVAAVCDPERLERCYDMVAGANACDTYHAALASPACAEVCGVGP